MRSLALTGSRSVANLAVIGSEHALDNDGTCRREQQTEQCYRATRIHGELPSAVRPSATRCSGLVRRFLLVVVLVLRSSLFFQLVSFFPASCNWG